MPRVYLSSPQHWYNACAVSGCDENTHNNEYLDELEVYLKAAGIETKRSYRRPPKDDTTDGTDLMIRAVDESDEWGADVHYVSHTNAYDGTVKGCRSMIYTGSTRGERLAEIMIKHRRAITGQSVTLFRRTDLYELRVPSAVSYYEEHVFHDNAEDARWFHENMRLVAEAAARGLCEYLGVAFVDPYAKKEDDGGVLPVVGCGTSGTAARAAMVLLKDRGFYEEYLSNSDTLFGPVATAATEKFQRENNIAVSGIVDQCTWKVLIGK